MQRYHLFMIVHVLFCTVLFSSATAAGDGKTNFAVVNLKSGEGVSVGESELITDRLRTELFKTGKVNMMERNQMQEILKEQGFQQSGICTDEACLVEMGQMLGVKVMVIGSLGKLGSMFMVNIRAIDVQTAQVVKVVSVDIKGDIEEVVDHLPEIAQKLTGEENAPQPIVQPEPKKTVLPEPEPEPPETETVEATPVNEVAENDVVVKKAYETPEKNRNRSGVGFTFNFFGEPVHMITNESFDEEFEGIFVLNPDSNRYVIISDSDFVASPSLFIDYLIRFYIRAGKYINIEIGPHIMIGTEQYTYSGENSFFDAEFISGYYIPGVHVGVDFVKRFHPLKINAGIFGKFSVPIVYYSLEYSNTDNMDYFSNESITPFFRFIPGLRTGAEILLGDHFGFSADFVFQAMQLELDFDFDEWDEDLYVHELTDLTQEVQFLNAGLAISANIYF